MIHRIALAFFLLSIQSEIVLAEFPYPSNPLPCDTQTLPPACKDPTDYAAYLFLPTTTPPVRPPDFGDDWKLTSDRTGELEIDSNPQELFGVKGASVDLAWQVTTGRPDVVIAVLDSGIEWHKRQPDLVNKFYLNRGELPPPEGSTNERDPWDRNGDGVFNIRDYLASGNHSQDSRVSDQNGNGVIDPEDLIFLFSDGTDADQNGYVDDISGWDFFEDDNDALDEVEYGHGTGEARDSAAEAGNGWGVGSCPNCMVLMVRVGDSFVADINAFARGVLFAVDNGASVVQEALGTLNNSSFAQAAVDYAYHRGVAVIASAADEESNHHNYPANLAHTVVVNSVTKYQEIVGVEMSPRSYLFLNGCTNYSPHVAVSVPSSACSSEATGKSSGMAGLLHSAARNAIDQGRLTRYPNGDGTYAGFPLSAEEVRQLFTMTADDINFDARPEEGLPQNYTIGGDFPNVTKNERFPSIAGFDQYFGYGRINANQAVRAVLEGRIPPEAAIETPHWFQTLDPDTDHIEVHGRVAANRAQKYSFRVEVAPGVQPAEEEFEEITSQQDLAAPSTGLLATIRVAPLVARMPHGVDGPPIDEQGKGDPDRFTFTVRVRVVDDQGNKGEDRRALFLHRDPDLITTTPHYLGTDGASSPKFADITGDGIEELIIATSDGLIHAFQGHDLREAPGWPVHSDAMEVQTEQPAFKSNAVAVPYTPFLGTPAIGDLDRDGSLEIVAGDLYGNLYVWSATGELRPGFPVRTLPQYSTTRRSERDLSTEEGRVPDRTNRRDRDNRTARGFGGGPALGNLDGSADGSLEIIAGSSDRHVYAWFNDGTPVPGWPVLLKDPAKVSSVDPITNEITLKPSAKGRMGSKITVPPSLGDIDGDGRLNVVIGPNEAYKERPNAVFDNLMIQLLQLSEGLDSGNGRLYALYPEGTNRGETPIEKGWNPAAFMAGWPVKLAMLTTELLPIVGTGINGAPALADLDRDGIPEIAGFTFLGPAYVLNGHGQSFLGDVRPGTPRTLEANVFGKNSNSVDSPGYPSLGGGLLAEMFGPGTGFQFIAPTAGLGKSLDTALPGKQSPAELHLSMWNVSTPAGTATSGEYRDGFPRVVNDLQFLMTPSAADITGDGVAESISGSGVYDLHAFSPDGSEAPGWPKFTGGWTVTSPAVGDLDGDGRLEVVSLTREGYLFLYRTQGSACGHIPWGQYHHDEWSTGNYDVDARPPGAVRGTLESLAGGIIELRVEDLPADDLFCGATAELDIRYASEPILTDLQFAAANRFLVSDVPDRGGRKRPTRITLQSQGSITGTVYVSARSIDDAGNVSLRTDLGQAILTDLPTQTPTSIPTPTASMTSARSPLPTATPAHTHTASPSATFTRQPTSIPASPTPTFRATAIAATPTAVVPVPTPAIDVIHTGGCAVVAPNPKDARQGWLLWLALAVAILRRRLLRFSMPEYEKR